MDSSFNLFTTQQVEMFDLAHPKFISHKVLVLRKDTRLTMNPV